MLHFEIRPGPKVRPKHGGLPTLTLVPYAREYNCNFQQPAAPHRDLSRTCILHAVVPGDPVLDSIGLLKGSVGVIHDLNHLAPRFIIAVSRMPGLWLYILAVTQECCSELKFQTSKTRTTTKSRPRRSSMRTGPRPSISTFLCSCITRRMCYQ